MSCKKSFSVVGFISCFSIVSIDSSNLSNFKIGSSSSSISNVGSICLSNSTTCSESIIGDVSISLEIYVWTSSKLEILFSNSFLCSAISSASCFASSKSCSPISSVLECMSWYSSACASFNSLLFSLFNNSIV